MAAPLNGVRSIEAKIRSPVWFRNNTGRKVNIIWLDYNGDRVSYGILDAQASPFAMNTFVTHPWIAVDEEDDKKMWLNSKEVFYPPTPRLVRVRQGARVGLLPRPMNVSITLPVYNAEKLQECCCQILAKTMKLENIDELQIPNFLRDAIKRYRTSED